MVSPLAVIGFIMAVIMLAIIFIGFIYVIRYFTSSSRASNKITPTEEASLSKEPYIISWEDRIIGKAVGRPKPVEGGKVIPEYSPLGLFAHGRKEFPRPIEKWAIMDPIKCRSDCGNVYIQIVLPTKPDHRLGDINVYLNQIHKLKNKLVERDNAFLRLRKAYHTGVDVDGAINNIERVLTGVDTAQKKTTIIHKTPDVALGGKKEEKEDAPG